MKLNLLFLFSVLALTACSSTISSRHQLIQPEFTKKEMGLVYSELIKDNSDPIDNINFLEINKNNSIHLEIKILRTNPYDNKQIRQSSHSLNTKLQAGTKYHVETQIKGEELSVWLINTSTREVVSTVSTMNTIFEKTFTLKEKTKSEDYRIKIILNNLQDKIANVGIINKRKPRYTWD